MSLAATRPAGPTRVSKSLGAVAVLCLLLFQGTAWTAGRAIELRDGSVLMGELVSAGNGTYRIRTPVLGELELPESEVLAIRSAVGPASDRGGALSGTTDLQGVMSAIQRRIVGDPTMASAVTALQSDPELQGALADPDFLQLILSGNIVALSTDPRFLSLMANPAIQSLLGQVGGQMGSQSVGD